MNDLERLRGLSEKATPGPWQPDPDGYCEYIWGPKGEMVLQIRGAGAQLPMEANRDFTIDCVNYVRSLLADSALRVGETGFDAGAWLAEHDGMRIMDLVQAAYEKGRTALATAPPERGAAHSDVPTLDVYDAGLLNDFGGGNVGWWLDSIRQHLAQAHEFYQEQVNNSWPAISAAPPIAEAGLREALVAMANDLSGEVKLRFPPDIRDRVLKLIERELRNGLAALRAIPDKSEEKEPG